MDYTAIEAKVEADMVRTELEPTPGRWWLDDLNRPVDGKCCLFSPQVIGKSVYRTAANVAAALGVGPEWINGAMLGFDGYQESSTVLSPDGLDGQEFGQRMRKKYVREAQDA